MARKQIALALGFWLSLFLLSGCNSNNQPASQEQPAGSESASANAGNSASSGKPELHHRKSESAASSAPAAPQTVTVPAGTVISVRLAEALSSGSAQAGGSFEGTLANALSVNGQEAAAVGSKVTGTIVNAVSSGRLSKPAELALTLTSLTPQGGSAIPISTSTWSASGASHKKRDAELIGGGAGLGALVGAIAGHGKGAAIGALAGAGAGTAGAAYTGKKEIQLAAETNLDFKLSTAVTLPVR